VDIENLRKKAEGRDHSDGRENPVEQVKVRHGKQGVNRLADGEGIVYRLGQQDEGKPEIFALRMADEEQAKDCEADQAGGDAVGIRVDKADVAGDLAMLLGCGKRQVAGQKARTATSGAKARPLVLFGLRHD
jgi:hypothetical protein